MKEKHKPRKIQLRYTEDRGRQLLGGASDLDVWYDQRENDGSTTVLSLKAAKQFLRRWNRIKYFGAVARAVRLQVPDEVPYKGEEGDEA